MPKKGTIPSVEDKVDNRKLVAGCDVQTQKAADIDMPSRKTERS